MTETETETGPETKDETETATEEEPKIEHPAESIGRMMSIYAHMVGVNISLSDKYSVQDKVALMRSAAFIMGQAHVMALTRIGYSPAAKEVPYLPYQIDSCMRAAEVLAATMLGETQEPAEEEPRIVVPDEPRIVVPGRANNRRARRANGKAPR